MQNICDAIASLRSALGEKYVITTAETIDHYSSDWSHIKAGKAAAILFPDDEEQLVHIMQCCHTASVPVVPAGGRTGLAGGAAGISGGFLISFERMNRIIHIDPLNMSIEAEAGVTTSQLQEAAAQAGLFFPLDLASRGSSQAGGNIATNAGGLRFVSFGGTREHVLGLRVVLADGKILDLNRALRKDNSGYDLKQLFIGSEGTLGLISRATFRLCTKPARTRLCFAGFQSLEDVLRLFQETRLQGLPLAAFEWADQPSLDLVLATQTQLKNPLSTPCSHVVWLEAESGWKDGPDDALEAFLEPLIHQGLICDAVIAGTAKQTEELWALRENITESLSATGHVRKNDISLPLSALCHFREDLMRLQQALDKRIRLMAFGHIGDGNIHLNYLGDRQLPDSDFIRLSNATEQEIYHLVRQYQGSISAEHGIGILKKNDLHFRRSPDEIDLMRQIKAILDPKHILNPGKLLPSSLPGTPSATPAKRQQSLL
ncbi:MAG: FAD-binding oxidoreductase [Deltaproteobacteria bacterium]|nr:FAD-binding oxidoreductase [Deltaproteobacteria bacterium]